MARYNESTRSFYVMDTETIYNTEINEAKIYLWASVGSNGTRQHGFDIKSMVEYISTIKAGLIFYHNLKFDGSFLINYLLKEGYICVNSASNLFPGQFISIISDMRQFYQVKIRFKDGNIVTIMDSLKIMPASVKDLSQAFNLNIHKLEIDYRQSDSEISEAEIEYCYRDCEVVLECLKIMREKGMTKITAGACALNYYKQILGGEDKFRRIFPVLPVSIDSYCRRSYKGGFVWVNPRYQNIEIKQPGEVFDVNSMFPAQMYYKPLPYGYPVYTEKLNDNNLWIGRVYVGHAKLKLNKIPCIQIKGGRYIDTEYLEEIEDEIIYITSLDYKLITEQYDTSDMRFVDGYVFKSRIGFFNEYIDEWITIKQNNKGAMRYIAKLMLNSLYGKFGLNPHRISLKPELENDIIRFTEWPEEYIESIYVPMAAFITAYARDNIIRNGQKIYDELCYIDTDSIHKINGGKIPFECHDSKLGAYKLESKFTRAKYIRPKTYIEDMGDGNYNIKCAGMPEKIKQNVTWENFKSGGKFSGKLQATQVKGGIALIERDFTIKL